MDLSKLTKLNGLRRRKKRVGRGIGSGKGGHTSSRGQKGQKARKGANIILGFEGGQTPLYKRLPQLGGFKNPTRKQILSVSLNKFNAFADGAEVTPLSLLEKKIVKRIPKHGVKVLVGGELKKKLVFTDFLFSTGAREQALKAGSKING